MVCPDYIYLDAHDDEHDYGDAVENMAARSDSSVNLEITLQEMWDLQRRAERDNLDMFGFYSIILKFHHQKRRNICAYNLYIEMRSMIDAKARTTARRVKDVIQHIPYPLDDDF